MTPETQKKMSGELQADLQALLDDAIKRNRQLEVTLHGVEALKNDFEDLLRAVEKASGWKAKDEPFPVYIQKLKEQRDMLLKQCEKLDLEVISYGYAISALRAECGLDRGSECFSDVAEAFHNVEKERDEAQAKCAKYREALYDVSIQECIGVKHLGVCCIEESGIIQIAEDALKSTDCGKGWVRVSGLEQTIEILKHLSSFKATWVNMTIDPEIERLTKLMEAK